MKKVQHIKIWFENCIVLELPIDEFEYIKIEDVGIRYEKCNSSCSLKEKYMAYGGVEFSLKPDVSRGRFLWLNEVEATDLPCNYDNIVKALTGESCYCTYMVFMVLCYDDGSEKEIYVPLKLADIDEDDVGNVLLSTRFDDDRCLVVEIHPYTHVAIEDDEE